MHAAQANHEAYSACPSSQVKGAPSVYLMRRRAHSEGAACVVMMTRSHSTVVTACSEEAASSAISTQNGIMQLEVGLLLMSTAKLGTMISIGAKP